MCPHMLPASPLPTCTMPPSCAGENPVPLVNEATGNKEGATRDNIPGLGDVSRHVCRDLPAKVPQGGATHM